jgi:putative FmdB family regulatory protein
VVREREDENMPIYEYQCEKCHHHLEALQKISDKPLRECPECGKHSLKRLLSAPLFRLAGSGWYETDFKSDKENRRNLAGKDEAPAEAGKAADGKVEAKTEKAEKTEKTEKVEKVDKSDQPKKGEKKIMVTKPAPRSVGKARPPAKKPAPGKSPAKKR